jgi:hypothetical protein
LATAACFALTAPWHVRPFKNSGDAATDGYTQANSAA